ncbi:hypothetical protein BZL43_24640 [Pseudomonas sp. PICF141]|nr:hypothetical protein BZL43_24640 [Pseudomonas sp. PICF141]
MGRWKSCKGQKFGKDRSHALRGNASMDALRPLRMGRGASRAAFPRRAWERSIRENFKHE